MDIFKNGVSLSEPQYLFIASEVRSGSTYFADAIGYSLYETVGDHFWDLSKEHFSNARSLVFDPLKIAENLYINRHGYRCAKLQVNEISVMLRHCKKCNKTSDLIFGPNTHWIILRRRSCIRQAVSLAYASKYKTYHYYEDPTTSPDSGMEISNSEIMESLRKISLSDIFLENLSKVLTRSKTIFYEDFLKDKKSTIENIFRELGIVDANQLKFKEPVIKRTNSAKKRQAEESFVEYFLNYYGRQADTQADTLNMKLVAFAESAESIEMLKGDTYELAHALLPFQPSNAFDNAFQQVKALETYKGLNKAVKKTLSNYVSKYRKAIDKGINYNGMTHGELNKALTDAKKAEADAMTPEQKSRSRHRPVE